MTAALTVTLRLLVVLLLGVAAAAYPGPAATAQPDPAPPVAAATPAIAWQQLGLSDKLQILGYNVATDVAVPVPQGVSPAVLTGLVGSAVDVVQGGRVDVLDARGSFLGSIPVPGGPVTEPFAVDLSAAQVTDGIAGLSFYLRTDNPSPNACAAPPSLTVSQLASTFSGPTPNPLTVADFLPGYLDQIVIRVGTNPSRDQQQAALDLVANLTRLYRPMPVRIDVDTSAEGVPPAESRRVIDLRVGGGAGMFVENPDTPAAVLAITGDGNDLQRQAALFVDRRFELVQTPSATVAASSEDDPKSADTKTFAQLGMTGKASVLGTTTIYTGFDAGAFAVGRIARASVHLLAKYSPVIGGEGSVLITSGATVIAAHELDESGSLDLSAGVPAAAISSTVPLSIEVRYLPKQECAPAYDRITFALDPQSTMTVTPGSDDTTGGSGFHTLPMAFLPQFDVTIDSPDHVRYAAQAINLMAQQTTALLRPRVTTPEQSEGNTGLLAISGGEDLKRADMKPPLLPGQANSFTTSGAPETTVETAGPMGVVQAFTHDGRTVLAVTGTDDWSLVDTAFDFIRGLNTRWASLTGDVVATGSAGQTVNLALADSRQAPSQGVQLARDVPSGGSTWRIWLPALVGGLVLVGLAVAGLRLVRRRRVSSRRTIAGDGSG